MRCEAPSSTSLVNQSVLRLLPPSVQTTAGLQSSSLQNTRLGVSTKHAERKRHSSPLPVCTADFLTLMHVCSLTHKPKNTLHVGGHGENQTLDGDFH